MFAWRWTFQSPGKQMRLLRLKWLLCIWMIDLCCLFWPPDDVCRYFHNVGFVLGPVLTLLNTFIIRCLIMACLCAVPLSCSTGLPHFYLLFVLFPGKEGWHCPDLLLPPPTITLSFSLLLPLCFFLPPISSSLPLCLMQLQYNNSVWVQ